MKLSTALVILFSLFLIFISIECSTEQKISASLERNFISPPREARPNVMWWWLNSYINEEGITRDLEEMKKQGIGGALIFDAAPVDRWKPKDVEPAPIGPPFMSERWRELFRHAIREADRLDLELGVSMTSGFNAGGPWVTPEFGQQEIVWSELVVDASTSSPIHLPLPSGPIYGENGELLTYNEMKVDNDLIHDKDGLPLHYKDIAVLALPINNNSYISAATKPTSQRNRLKNWALKSVHSFDYPEDKGFKFDAVYENVQGISDELKIDKESIIDLTGHLQENGYLNWQVPQGKWMILRFGHTHTDIRLQATNPHNEGLAMNHLSQEAAKSHFDEIGKKMLEDISATGVQSLIYFYLDSWEVRITNWTAGFRTEFKKRRGYDMTPYLPVLSGIIVENREISNRFLHDYRMTIGDCIADNYYGTFGDLSRQNGLQFRAEMATTPIPVDMLKCLGRVDLPFGEFWTETDLPKGRIEPWERKFGKQAASAAHIYGKKYSAAEALTVIQKHWEHSPFQLKKTVDQALCSGINRLMIHTFTHSPLGVKAPGYEYFAGTHFNPQITWWNQAHAFTDYISRCQYLLQQGHFVADVCFYQGDQIPAFVPMKQSQPGLGDGYDYDIVNTEVILSRMSVDEGWLVLPDGMRYRLMVLPETDMINPAVLQKIRDLVQQGATVIGAKPTMAYGLENYPQSDSLIKIIAGQLWGDCDGEAIKENAFGKGRIINGKTAREVLTNNDIPPDFEFKCTQKDADIDYIHRHISKGSDDIDIYFVINSRERWEEIECTFRIDNRVPEVWDPGTGKIIEQLIYNHRDGHLTMPLRLPPFGSAYIVFRKPSGQIHVNSITRNSEFIYPGGNYPVVDIPIMDIKLAGNNQLLIEAWQAGTYLMGMNTGQEVRASFSPPQQPFRLNGIWKIKFPCGWGAPDSVSIKKLISWTNFPVEGIKYFSGTATYETDFLIEAIQLRPNTSYYLDLGVVKDMAEIVLNDQKLPILWKKPFRADITPWLQSGQNRVEIKITNLWPNRLIGDQWLPKEARYTYTNIGKFTKDSPLIESGLSGPVQIYRVAQQVVDF